jgi:DUF4097 and DUF4098 domain-containing protein YvlB
VSDGIDARQRRSSLFVGVLLILLGLVFLIDRFAPQFGLGHVIRLYWPVLVILWGAAKLIDHRSAQKSGEPHGPLLSGGEAALLVLVALVLATFVFRDWLRNEFPGIEIHLPAMGRSSPNTESIPPVEIPAGAHVSVETARGDIKIVGVDGNELRVSVRASGTGGDGKLRGANAVIDVTGDGYRIHPAGSGWLANSWRSPATVDFDVQVPRTAVIAANTSHGDISAEGTASGLDARTGSGNIRIQNAGANVSADTRKGDARIDGVRGNVQVRGGGDDVQVADVTGDVSIDGAFLGDTRIRKVDGTLRVKSPHADVTLVQLTGDLTLDSDDLSLSGAAGSVQITARDKDIKIEDALGRLDVANSHGDIAIAFAKPPRVDISITNDSGDVTLALPPQSAFQISAESRSGEVESDFETPSLRRAQETEVERLNGAFGSPLGGSAPKIAIATSYGTIRVNKSK